MDVALDHAVLEPLSRKVTERLGISFPVKQWDVLARAFSRAGVDLGFADFNACARWFITTPNSRELVEKVADYLTIGETYFMREKNSLEIIAREIVPQIANQRCSGEKRLRLWSVGCASGEEAYSLAILLHRMKEQLRGLDISIMATDINPNCLHKAREGIYNEWSFRSVPLWFKHSYFTPLGRGRF
ncbi:MAG: CheR family methyltransferase [Desulfuromonas sp.]|nr:CheR family methyltransferase [Desulfuromonas sp.]